MPDWKNIIIRFDNEHIKIDNETVLGIYGFGFKQEKMGDLEANKKISVAAAHLEPETQTLWWPFINRIDDYPFWERDTINSLFDNADTVIQYYQAKIIQLFALAEKLKSNGVEL